MRKENRPITLPDERTIFMSEKIDDAKIWIILNTSYSRYR